MPSKFSLISMKVFIISLRNCEGDELQACVLPEVTDAVCRAMTKALKLNGIRQVTPKSVNYYWVVVTQCVLNCPSEAVEELEIIDPATLQNHPMYEEYMSGWFQETIEESLLKI